MPLIARTSHGQQSQCGSRMHAAAQHSARDRSRMAETRFLGFRSREPDRPQGRMRPTSTLLEEATYPVAKTSPEASLTIDSTVMLFPESLLGRPACPHLRFRPSCSPTNLSSRYHIMRAARKLPVPDGWTKRRLPTSLREGPLCRA